MLLTHPFLFKCYDFNKLLDNCDKLSTFSNRLVRQSMQKPNHHCPLKYRGHGFELFVEALFKLSPVDNRLGMYNYKPTEVSEDTGVDATGTGINGKNAAVQIKFCSNKETLLTANKDRLMNFGFAAQNKYSVDIEDKNNMIIVTNAKALHHFTSSEMFLNKVHVVHYKTLSGLVNNNIAFWNLFRELVANSLDYS